MRNRRSGEEERRAGADVAAFESHLQQLYLYYKARRRRGQAVVVVSLAWACYNVSVWIQGWVAAGEISWFLLLNTVGSVALASVCVRSTYRDSQVYVPHRYETGCNSILRLLGLSFEGGKSAGDALKRRHISMAKSGEGSGTTSTRTSWKTGSR